MPVDLAFTIPLTLIGLSAARAADRHRSSPELPPSVAGDWSKPAPVHRPAMPSTASPEMTARFYPNGQLAELRGPAEIVGRAVLGLRPAMPSSPSLEAWSVAPSSPSLEAWSVPPTSCK